MIDIIFSDIDGCLMPDGYDPLGKFSLTQYHSSTFEFYRGYTGPQIVIVTGRSFDNTIGILEQCDFFSKTKHVWPFKPQICEHGLDIILDPINLNRISLLDTDKKFSSLKAAANKIGQLGNFFIENEDNIIKKLSKASNSTISPLIILNKRYSLAVNIPFIEKTRQRLDSILLYDTLWDIAGNYLDIFQLNREILITIGSEAIDFIPSISKLDAIEYLLTKIGTKFIKTAYLGDSHSDLLPIMNVDYPCCPSNASAEIKNYISKNAELGYISPYSFDDGGIDILRHLSNL